MKTTLIPIGNSRGVRIPKPLIEQCGLSGEIEMDVRDRAIIIRSPSQPRQGWEKSFAQMARLKDDTLLDAQPISSKFDDEDWQWK
jgi:antitoxin MazE